MRRRPEDTTRCEPHALLSSTDRTRQPRFRRPRKHVRTTLRALEQPIWKARIFIADAPPRPSGYSMSIRPHLWGPLADAVDPYRQIIATTPRAITEMESFIAEPQAFTISWLKSRSEDGSHDFHVLLRQRPRSIPQLQKSA